MPENFFVVSKGNLELAVDEIIAIARSYDRSARIEVHTNLVLVQTKTPWQKIHRRASYVKNAGQAVKRLSDLFPDGDAGKILCKSGTFACRVLNLSGDRFDPSGVERLAGDAISRHSSARVSLRNPDFVIYVIIAEECSFFGFSTGVRKHGRPRRARAHPSQLDWRLTRAMINLCGLREGETVCDPFCGTGTTLLEAESMGVHGIGIDIDGKMSDMARKNVAWNGYGSEIINDDFKRVAGILDRVDGVVTDIPYGRNSKVPIAPEVLITDLMRMLPKKRFAIMCKAELAEQVRLKNIRRYSIYRHKSLTRTILVR